MAPSVTYSVTASQLAELLLALDHHRGLDAGTSTGADLKQWGARHFKGLAMKYRESQSDTANPLDTSEVTS